MHIHRLKCLINLLLYFTERFQSDRLLQISLITEISNIEYNTEINNCTNQSIYMEKQSYLLYHPSKCSILLLIDTNVN